MAESSLNYTKIGSPIGKVHLLASAQGLTALYFDPQVEKMDRRFPRVKRTGPRRNPLAAPG